MGSQESFFKGIEWSFVTREIGFVKNNLMYTEHIINIFIYHQEEDRIFIIDDLFLITDSKPGASTVYYRFRKILCGFIVCVLLKEGELSPILLVVSFGISTYNKNIESQYFLIQQYPYFCKHVSPFLQ